MIKVVTEEMHGSDRVPDLNTDCERALVGHGTFSTRAKWRSSTSACSSMLEKYLTAPTLLEMPGCNSHVSLPQDSTVADMISRVATTPVLPVPP